MSSAAVIEKREPSFSGSLDHVAQPAAAPLHVKNCSILIGNRKVVILPLNAPIFASEYFRSVNHFYEEKPQPRYRQGFVEIEDFDKDPGLLETFLKTDRTFKWINSSNILNAIELSEYFQWDAPLGKCDEALADKLNSWRNEEALKIASRVAQREVFRKTRVAFLEVEKKKNPITDSMAKALVNATKEEIAHPDHHPLRNYINTLAASGTRIVYLDLSCVFDEMTALVKAGYLESREEKRMMYWRGDNIETNQYVTRWYKIEPVYKTDQLPVITDEILIELLGALPNLRSITLSKLGAKLLTDAIVPHLRNLPNLQELVAPMRMAEAIKRQIPQMTMLHQIDFEDEAQNGNLIQGNRKARLLSSFPHLAPQMVEERNRSPARAPREHNPNYPR